MINAAAADDTQAKYEVRAEPIVALAFVENDLQCTEADGKQPESDVINAEIRAAAFFHVRRIGDQHIGEEQRDDSDGNIDEENPAPIEIVGNPAAQSGADRGRQNHGHAVNGERHAALFRRERVRENRLLARLESAAAHALKYPEKNQQRRDWEPGRT